MDTTAVAGTVTDFDFFPAGGLNVRVATGKVLDEDFFWQLQGLYSSSINQKLVWVFWRGVVVQK